jgi:hypothetical protein
MRADMESVAARILEIFAISAQITTGSVPYRCCARLVDPEGDQFLGELASRLYRTRARIPGES